MVKVEAIGHLVLTVASVAITRDFYERVLGMRAVTFGEGRTALAFGRQKINLHPAPNGYAPGAAYPTPGSADLCLLTDIPLSRVITHLEDCGVEVEEGPVMRTGARGPIESVYLRDPDGNLIEIANAR
ncbi:MAG: VOC family protein [Leptospirillia bacterium]